MDRECIKKHKDVFEAWLQGKEIEYRALSIDEWKTIDSPKFVGNLQYRIKPEVVHYYIENTGKVLCGRSDICTTTVIKQKVTCPDCLAKMCKYPNLRQAIIERKELKIRVNIEQSKDVQKIAGSCGVFWPLRENLEIIETNSEYLFLDAHHSKYAIKCGYNEALFQNYISPEFYLSTDSFNAPLPDWCKVGAKCFTEHGLAEITDIHSSGLVSYEQLELEKQPKHSKHISGRTRNLEYFTPAAYRPPTYESLLPFAPLALCPKGVKKAITVDWVDDVAVYFKNGEFCHLKDLSDKYTFTDGSEIGEWGKGDK